MLTVPARRRIGDTLVFADDQQFWRFYPLPDRPSIRRGPDGEPVFLLVKYQLSDQDRAADPDLPAGGGVLSFDLELATDEAALRVALQPEVDAEWARRRAGTAAERTTVAAMAAPPPVELRPPAWTGAHLTVSAPDAGDVSGGVVLEVEPSLFDGVRAFVRAEVSHQGAFLLEQLLLGGGTSPIQVVLEGRFLARLPAVSVRAVVATETVLRQVHATVTTADSGPCTPTTFRTSTSQRSTFESSGTVGIVVDVGAAGLPETAVDALRDFAFAELTEQILGAVFEPVDGGPMGPHTRLALVADVQTRRTSFEVALSQQAVVQWPASPQGTLVDVLGTGDPARLLRRVDLDQDEVFRRLDFEVVVSAPFSTGEVDLVEVSLEYHATDEQGVARVEAATLDFTTRERQRFTPLRVGGARAVRWRSRSRLAGGVLSPWTAWGITESDLLVVEVGRPGLVRVEVLAAGIDFEGPVREARVTLSVGPGTEETLVLTPSRLDATYERRVAGPVRAHTRFLLASGDVLDLGEAAVPEGPLLVMDPFAGRRLQVTLVPGGDGWDEVAGVVVDLRYGDGLAPGDEVSLAVAGLDDAPTWTMPLGQGAATSFAWRVHTSRKDGSYQRGDWRAAEGSQAVPVMVSASARRHVRLLPTLLDFTVAPRTEVQVRAGSAVSPVFFFTDPTATTWSMGLDVGPVLATVTHHPASGPPMLMADRPVEGDLFVVPPYRPPATTRRELAIYADLVDYTLTPLVRVELEAGAVRQALEFRAPERRIWAFEAQGDGGWQGTITWFGTDDARVHRQVLAPGTGRFLVVAAWRG